jgi:hypothetical protein
MSGLERRLSEQNYSGAQIAKSAGSIADAGLSFSGSVLEKNGHKNLGAACKVLGSACDTVRDLSSPYVHGDEKAALAAGNVLRTISYLPWFQKNDSKKINKNTFLLEAILRGGSALFSLAALKHEYKNPARCKKQWADAMLKKFWLRALADIAAGGNYVSTVCSLISASIGSYAVMRTVNPDAFKEKSETRSRVEIIDRKKYPEYRDYPESDVDFSDDRVSEKKSEKDDEEDVECFQCYESKKDLLARNIKMISIDCCRCETKDKNGKKIKGSLLICTKCLCEHIEHCLIMKGESLGGPSTLSVKEKRKYANATPRKYPSLKWVRINGEEYFEEDGAWWRYSKRARTWVYKKIPSCPLCSDLLPEYFYKKILNEYGNGVPVKLQKLT